MSFHRIHELEALVQKLDSQLTLCRQQYRLLQTETTVAQNNALHWKRRYEMVQGSKKANATIFELNPERSQGLLREATLRGVKPDQLAKKIVETVVKDKLFSAVLDQ